MFQSVRLKLNGAWLAILIVGSFSSGIPALTRAGSKAVVKLESFGYKDVTLSASPLESQAREARNFYLQLSEESLLQGFRIRAGLPAPGNPMGGWYDPDGFAGGHPFGQFVSALARMYASTGDVRFKAKVARLVHGFRETLGPDGFFYSSAKVLKEWPCYLYDKNCIGMREAYVLTGNTEALTVLSRMTDWAVKNLPRRSDEWYTLPENLYNCYDLTGEPRYLQLAREYDYSEGFYDLFAKGENAFTPNRHAYSHVNTLCSAARVFEATGNSKYFVALENAWRFLTTTQMYASGGWGPNERFVEPGKGKLASSLTTTGQGFETPCGSNANVNLDRYMLRFTASAKYGDNMERVLYNGILAALPPRPDGHAFYYSDYRPGTTKTRRPDLWTCCSGTYAQATADYPLDIYFHDAKDLYVNLFVPSTVHWSRGGSLVTVTQHTSYPDQFSTRLDIQTAKPAKFGVCVRVPGWAIGPLLVRVNGKPSSGRLTDGKFLRIERTWRRSDSVSVEFPSALRFEPVDAQTPDRVALMNGPLLMVALADKDLELVGDVAKPGGWLLPSLERATDLSTRDGRVTFRPFFRVVGERYTTYCRVR